MLLRWFKRACWSLLLLALILIPARLANGPTSAQAARDFSAAPVIPFQSLTPVTLTAAALVLLSLVALRHRHPHS